MQGKSGRRFLELIYLRDEIMVDENVELSKECKRLSESCQYTSASIYIWLRCLRLSKMFFIAAPLILGSMSSWKLLTSSDVKSIQNMVAIFAFLAGLLPAIYAALKFDERLERYVHAAGEYKNLEHRFRKLSNVDSKRSYQEYEDKFEPVMQRFEQLNSLGLTVPEWCFKRAQKKVKAGDYTFDADSQIR